MDFDNLLSRADEEILQGLLGPATVHLLCLLDPKLASPACLRQLAIDLHTREGLLTTRSSRMQLLQLLRPEAAKRLAAVLGIPVGGNPFAALDAATIGRGSERERALFDFFELPLPQTGASGQGGHAGPDTADYPLFPHQRTARRSVTRLLDQEPRRVLLHMPTGAGKTRTAMHAVADHLRQQEPGLVIWLAYSEELCEQAAAEFQAAWRSLGDREVQVYRYWGSRRLDLDQLQDGVVVASLSKLYRAGSQSLAFIAALSNRCTLVVIDEAHQAVAESYRLILDTLVVARNSPLLGLTATPGRTWADIAADQELADFFGRRKVTLSVQGYGNPVDYLVDSGYLARATHRTLMGQCGLKLSPRDEERVRTELDIPDDVLAQLASDEKRNLRIVLELEDLTSRHRRIIAFASSVKHSKLLACVLRARGLWASSIVGTTPPLQRAQAIADFKSDQAIPMVLCNYGVLTTGFDAPKTSAAVIARPTKSLVLYSQMVGRALRGPKAGGNEEAEIVTVVDSSLPGFNSTADAFRNWEDVWE